MAAKIKSKGTSWLVSISAVYTVIPSLKSLSVSGEKSETYDSTTLDGGVFKTKDPTGYAEPCTMSGDVFYDPADTVHVFLIGLIAAPVATNFKVTYADTAPTSAIYSGTGFGFDKTASPADGLTGTITVETSGAPA